LLPFSIFGYRLAKILKKRQQSNEAIHIHLFGLKELPEIVFQLHTILAHLYKKTCVAYLLAAISSPFIAGFLNFYIIGSYLIE
jgi:hypothetical protein